MTTYCSTICQSVNLKTGISRYYIKKCGVFQRVSHDEFHERNNMADTWECIWSQSVRGVRRFYSTVIWSE